MNKKKGISGTITGGLCWDRLTVKRMKDPAALENYGYKVYSQNDEDGIIHEIFRRIGTGSKEFIEFGVGNGLECNSHYLLHQRWHGLWMEGSRSCCKDMGNRFRTVIKTGRLRVVRAFITRDNIDGLICRGRNTDTPDTPPDLLSIDIDGNDWYVWQAIKCIKPRVVCIEYNGKFPPDHSWKQAYDAGHIWDRSDWQGASLKAMEELGREKGYTLVGTNLSGVNAFFVRDDLFSKELFSDLHTAEELYNPYRSTLKFASPGHASRYCLADQEENRGILNYYTDRSAYSRAEFKRKLGSFLSVSLHALPIWGKIGTTETQGGTHGKKKLCKSHHRDHRGPGDQGYDGGSEEDPQASC